MQIIGVLGGMGPLATVDFFQKIIHYTDAGCDQDHIHIIIDSNPQVPDRTRHILGEGESPLTALVASALRLELLGADVLVMPCNTAHYYYSEIKRFVHVPFINMIVETAGEIRSTRPTVSRIGLLATAGTCASGIYESVFQECGFNVIRPDALGQQQVDSLIYGIKSGGVDLERGGIEAVLGELKGKGAETFVLGCTELPIAWRRFDLGEDFVDPTAILARSAIRAIGKGVKIYTPA